MPSGTSHYLNHCWPSSPTPYGITRPQWVKLNTSSLRLSIRPGSYINKTYQYLSRVCCRGQEFPTTFSYANFPIIIFISLFTSPSIQSTLYCHIPQTLSNPLVILISSFPYNWSGSAARLADTTRSWYIGTNQTKFKDWLIRCSDCLICN